MRNKEVPKPLRYPDSGPRVGPSLRGTSVPVSSERLQGIASKAGRVSTVRDRDEGRGGIRPLSTPQQSSREIRVFESPQSASCEQRPMPESISARVAGRAAGDLHEGATSVEAETSTVSWISCRQMHAPKAGYICVALRMKAKIHPTGLHRAILKPVLLLIPIV